jgi:hypothetical protein
MRRLLAWWQLRGRGLLFVRHWDEGLLREKLRVRIRDEGFLLRMIGLIILRREGREF